MPLGPGVHIASHQWSRARGLVAPRLAEEEPPGGGHQDHPKQRRAPGNPRRERQHLRSVQQHRARHPGHEGNRDHPGQEALQARPKMSSGYAPNCRNNISVIHWAYPAESGRFMPSLPVSRRSGENALQFLLAHGEIRQRHPRRDRRNGIGGGNPRWVNRERRPELARTRQRHALRKIDSEAARGGPSLWVNRNVEQAVRCEPVAQALPWRHRIRPGHGR